MSARRIKVVFAETIEADTFENFAVVLEIFGRTYQTEGRTVLVLPEPSRAADLRLQLTEWEQEGAVLSWADAT